MDTWTHGHMDTWTHGHMDTWTHGHMDTWKIHCAHNENFHPSGRETRKTCRMEIFIVIRMIFIMRIMKNPLYAQWIFKKVHYAHNENDGWMKFSKS